MTSSTPQDIDCNLNASNTSSSTTGMSSFQLEDGVTVSFEERGDNVSFVRGTDQGPSLSAKRPHALCTASDQEAPAGYEPKPSSTRVVGGNRRVSSRVGRNTLGTEPTDDHVDISGESVLGQRWSNELADVNEKIENLMVKTEKRFLSCSTRSKSSLGYYAKGAGKLE